MYGTLCGILRAAARGDLCGHVCILGNLHLASAIPVITDLSARALVRLELSSTDIRSLILGGY